MDDQLASPSEDKGLRAELELARRLLEELYPGGSMELQVGVLPTLLSPNFPLPDGARVVGSMSREGQLAQGIIETPQPLEDARAFYAERLPALGWEASALMRAGGFIAGPVQIIDRYVSRERGKMVALTCVERAEGGVVVRLMVMDAPPQEAMRGADPRSMRMHSSIPPLTAPQGATLQPGGGGGSGDSWWSHARMTASLDLGHVMAHFDRQLATGGWSRVESGTSSHAGWSLWSVKVDERAYIGVFNVIQMPDQADLYLLQARVEALAPMQSGGMGWTSSYGTITSSSARGESSASAVSMRVEGQQKPGEGGESGDAQGRANPNP